MLFSVSGYERIGTPLMTTKGDRYFPASAYFLDVGFSIFAFGQ
jgi:hypothetical protein